MKTYILIILFLLLFNFSAPAQQSVTDSDFLDVTNSIEGTFPERQVTGKVVDVHDGGSNSLASS
ncbi:MAG: hypothetical protein LC778_08355 [Acidobacteria bacterium]|nr:hypothetical protein [Acidobacteriota bacterium]